MLRHCQLCRRVNSHTETTRFKECCVEYILHVGVWCNVGVRLILHGCGFTIEGLRPRAGGSLVKRSHRRAQRSPSTHERANVPTRRRSPGRRRAQRSPSGHERALPTTAARVTSTRRCEPRSTPVHHNPPHFTGAGRRRSQQRTQHSVYPGGRRANRAQPAL